VTEELILLGVSGSGQRKGRRPRNPAGLEGCTAKVANHAATSASGKDSSTNSLKANRVGRAGKRKNQWPAWVTYAYTAFLIQQDSVLRIYSSSDFHEGDIHPLRRIHSGVVAPDLGTPQFRPR